MPRSAQLFARVVFSLLVSARPAHFEPSGGTRTLFCIQNLHEIPQFCTALVHVVCFGGTCDHLLHLRGHFNLFAARKQDLGGPAHEARDVWQRVNAARSGVVEVPVRTRVCNQGVCRHFVFVKRVEHC